MAYAVQSVLTRHRLASGQHIVGRKIGLTSLAVQAQPGVHQPDFGVLCDGMRVAPGETANMARLLRPKIEAEIALVLGADLDGPPSMRRQPSCGQVGRARAGNGRQNASARDRLANMW